MTAPIKPTIPGSSHGYVDKSQNCPFCESDKIWRKINEDHYSSIVCDDCGASTRFHPNSELAWTAWNKRAKTEPEQPDALEALADLIKLAKQDQKTATSYELITDRANTIRSALQARVVDAPNHADIENLKRACRNTLSAMIPNSYSETTSDNTIDWLNWQGLVIKKGGE